ncbi:hypothetical protein AMTR_s00083p00050770 [Amborella trichopoda]|uniref:Uncharacterized protein n=1 Tax=Amborella trichopoda TaxID=13333 RepID=W1NY02_AMBTC|nr:hypothetical protein AMTR_s00083p00050770 [Amborella trichopoda]
MRDAKLRFLWADLETLRKRTGPRLVPLLILPDSANAGRDADIHISVYSDGSVDLETVPGSLESLLSPQTQKAHEVLYHEGFSQVLGSVWKGCNVIYPPLHRNHWLCYVYSLNTNAIENPMLSLTGVPRYIAAREAVPAGTLRRMKEMRSLRARSTVLSPRERFESLLSGALPGNEPWVGREKRRNPTSLDKGRTIRVATR